MPMAQSIESVEVAQDLLLNQLTDTRKLLGLTQAELADRVGLNRMTVQRTEAGEVDPQLSTVLALAAALNLRMTLRGPGEDDSAPVPQDLVHRGLHHVRTQHDLTWRDRQREKALAKAWEAANRHEPVGLAAILPTLLPGCTQAQASACATVVQWLGSEVGFEFLQCALADAGYEVVDRKAKR
jgi:transcriptional regulator with XRE-family HTH domain